MEKSSLRPRGLAFSIVLTVVIICVATAIICTAFLFLSNLNLGAGTKAEFYAIGKSYSELVSATTASQSERRQGRAGFVFASNEGFLLTYAVYADKADAESVAQKNDCKLLTLTIPSVSLNESDSEGFSAVLELAVETEKLWRQLDGGETSESLAVTMLSKYADALGAYKNSEAMGELIAELRTELLLICAGSGFPLTSDLKRISAQTAVRAWEFARKM
ncbi:MAG: hypothetical protein IJX05_04275 [Clostridia bacterium]|nr:hypothetical protein [Clostridia bacterium]